MRGRFIQFVQRGEVSFAQACARFGISRKTGYKWWNRFQAEGPAGLLERDRAPRSRPGVTPLSVQAQVLRLAQDNPTWSGERVRRELAARGVEEVPAQSTIDAIRRRARIGGPVAVPVTGAPNDVWSLEMGPVTVSAGLNHRAMVIRDEASGFVVAAEVVAERGEAGCRELMWAAFERQGLPRRIRWPAISTEATSAGEASCEEMERHTRLTVELMRLGIAMDWAEIESPTKHAATEEAEARARAGMRRHATELGPRTRALLAEGETAAPPPLARRRWEKLARWRARLAAWVDHSNAPSRHRVGDGRRPIDAYRPSPRRLADASSPDCAAEEGEIRVVSEKGVFQFRGQAWRISRVFAGERVAIRPGWWEDEWIVSFCDQPLALLTLGSDNAPGSGVRGVQSIDAAGDVSRA